MSKLVRSFAVLASISALVMFSGCSSGSEGPRNTMIINGTEVAIDYADVWYYQDIRYVRFTDPIGDYVEFTFENQGDPAIYEIPFGTWNQFDSDLTEVHVYLVTGPTSATYTGSVPYSCQLAAGGHEPDRLEMETAWTFEDGPISDVDISYGGPYSYTEDK